MDRPTPDPTRLRLFSTRKYLVRYLSGAEPNPNPNPTCCCCKKLASFHVWLWSQTSIMTPMSRGLLTNLTFIIFLQRLHLDVLLTGILTVEFDKVKCSKLVMSHYIWRESGLPSCEQFVLLTCNKEQSILISVSRNHDLNYWGISWSNWTSKGIVLIPCESDFINLSMLN